MKDSFTQANNVVSLRGKYGENTFPGREFSRAFPDINNYYSIRNMVENAGKSLSDTPAMQALEVKRDEKSQKLQIDFNYKLLGDEKFTVTEADVRGANDIKNAINKYLIKINDFNNNFIATELNRIKTESNGDAGSKETTVWSWPRP